MPIQRPQNAQAVDRWVQQSLADRYGATLREPVPDSLLKLLSEARPV